MCPRQRDSRDKRQGDVWGMIWKLLENSVTGMGAFLGYRMLGLKMKVGSKLHKKVRGTNRDDGVCLLELSSDTGAT